MPCLHGAGNQTVLAGIRFSGAASPRGARELSGCGVLCRRRWDSPFWGNIRVLRNWLHFFLMLGLFVAAWEIMGYVHATDASGMMMKRHLALQWWPITVLGG